MYDYVDIGFSQGERLEALRELVKLNPVDYIRVKKARMQAEAFRDLYIRENPSDIIGVDYSIADDLEYQLRLAAYERICEPGWRAYLNMEHDGYGLREYAVDGLKQYLYRKAESAERSKVGRGM